jgi:hypothetical protein
MSTNAHHRLTRPLSIATLGACATLLAATIANAQSSFLPKSVIEAGATAAESRAQSLERQAVALSGTPRSYRTIARLYRRAAQARGTTEKAAEDCRLSAWAYVAVQDHGSGRAMMERAAEISAAVGDIDRAANSYVDAAIMAREGGRDDLVTGLLDKTRALAESRVLSPERRAAILARIEEAPKVAQMPRSR